MPFRLADMPELLPFAKGESLVQGTACAQAQAPCRAGEAQGETNPLFTHERGTSLDRGERGTVRSGELKEMMAVVECLHKIHKIHGIVKKTDRSDMQYPYTSKTLSG